MTDVDIPIYIDDEPVTVRTPEVVEMLLCDLCRQQDWTPSIRGYATALVDVAERAL